MKPPAYVQAWVLALMLAGVAFGAAVLAWGVHDLADTGRMEALAKDVVDGWEPATTVHFFQLRLLALMGAAALVVACLPVQWHGAVRASAGLTVALSVAAFVVTLCAHIALTERMTALTGQTVARGWGLWR